MALKKSQKKKIIEDLKEKIARQKAMIFVDFTGLKVKDLSNLRKKIKEVAGELKITKKTLLFLALKDYYPLVAQKVKKLRGEVAIVFSFKDEISSTKTIWQFSQEKPNLKILGGFFENKFREAEDIITLAQVPTREELLANLVRSISSPISGLINVFQGNIKGLMYALSAINK